MKARSCGTAGRKHASHSHAPQDLTREMAKEWQTVSAEERKICDDIAAQNKAAYEEAMKLYQTTLQIGGGVADGEEVRLLRRDCELVLSPAQADADM